MQLPNTLVYLIWATWLLQYQWNAIGSDPEMCWSFFNECLHEFQKLEALKNELLMDFDPFILEKGSLQDGD